MGPLHRHRGRGLDRSLIIITILAVLTWRSTHALDPYKPLVSEHKPVTIEVVSLDWKWLFIYPEYDIATVNEIAFPWTCR